jgi:hypothetical protein
VSAATVWPRLAPSVRKGKSGSAAPHVKEK